MRGLPAKAVCLLGLVPVIPTMPAWAQEVTLGELRGATVSIRLLSGQKWRRGDQGGYAQLEYELAFTFGANDVVQVSWAGAILNNYGYGQIGRPPQPHQLTSQRTAAVKIGVVKKGSIGHRVLVFQNGTLTQLETVRKGGRKLEVKFARTADGLTCTARQLWMRETGVDGIVGRSPWAGVASEAPTEVIAERQISQTCSIAKQ